MIGLFGLVLALAGSTVEAQVDGVDLLPPSVAFRLEVSRPQAERMRVRWTIAEGYYLYRERFRFEVSPGDLLDTVTLPPGIVKQDPFFGRTEIYRHRVEFDLPLAPDVAAAGLVTLRVLSQGCADIGICFPPEAREVRLGVGQTAVAEAQDAFAPARAGDDPGLYFLLPPPQPRPPRSGLSP